MHRLDAETAAGDQPRGHRVRVPPLACLELVASPDRRGHIWHEVKDALRDDWVVCQSLWALHRFVNVWDRAITPASDLVPEDWSDRAQRLPTGPSATTPRSDPFPSRIGAISITNIPPDTLTSSAEW
jgi:hypothetical protein